MKPRFRSGVISRLAPSLLPHGFLDYQSHGGVVIFERTLRGHKNSITVDTLSWPGETVKEVRFLLQAPKGQLPHGALPGGSVRWTYETHEELLSDLDAMKTLIVNEGLDWLDAYTPGNIPDWEPVVRSKIEPVLHANGFQRQAPMQFHLPDSIWYENSESLLMVDLRMPGVVAAAFVDKAMRSTGVTPQYRYSDEQGFRVAVMNLAQHLARTLPARKHFNK